MADYRGYSNEFFSGLNPGISAQGGRFNQGKYDKFARGFNDYQGRVTQEFYRSATGYFQAEMSLVASQVMSVCGGFLSETVAQFLGALEHAARDNQAIARGMERAASYGQLATVEAYHRNVDAPRRVPSYSTRSHLGGGALQRALESPDFFRVSGNGVTFGNTAVLDAVAPQWARLNYGAGAKATGGPYGDDGHGGVAANYKPTYSPQTGRSQSRFTFGNLALPNKPRPPFSVPPGLWRQDGHFVFPSFNPEGSTAEFRPYSQETLNTALDSLGLHGKERYSARRKLVQKRVPTAGIAARRFLDIGAREFFGAAQTEMVGVLNHWIEIAEGTRYVYGKTGFGPFSASGGAHGISVKASTGQK